MGAALLALGLISASGCESKGTAGANGTSCSANKPAGSTTTTITCTDGTSVTIEDGAKGATGGKGDTGDAGAKGDTGAQGPAGVAGPEGPQGPSGANSTPCSVVDNGDNTKTVTCGTTSVKLSDGVTGTAGQNGENAAPCQLAVNDSGTKTITCDGNTIELPAGNTGATGETGAPGEPGANGNDGLPGANGLPGTNGKDAIPCTVVDMGGGNKKITCGDGSTVTISNGSPVASFIVSNFHGIDYLMTTGQFAAGAKSFVTAKITSAPVIDATTGKVTLTWTVVDAANKPVTGIKSVGFTIAKLVQPNGDASSSWVNYIYTTSTAGACTTDPTKVTSSIPLRIPCWNDPPYNVASTATTTYAAREKNNADPTKGGTLTESATTPGTYTYTSLVNLNTAKNGANVVGFDPTLTHRVAVMMGGSSGPTTDAWLDFRPDGQAIALTRDIVQTDSCKSCHGPFFKGHGGDRIHVETCVLCHNPSSVEVRSGNSVDFKVMIHKIHAGSSLQSIPGADGIVFDNPSTGTDETADNGKYFFFSATNITWWDVGFPAEIANCTKCHQGTGKDVDNWKKNPSIDACTSCHDQVNVSGVANPAQPIAHLGQPSNCTMCHPADGPGVGKSISGAHDWTIADPRNISEYNVAMTVSAPTNGKYFVAGESPVISIALKDMLKGTALDTSSLPQDITPEGCNTAGCAAADGAFPTASLFVHGPRAENKPVLSYAARAVLVATAAAPFDLTGAKGLSLIFDGGKDIAYKDVTGGDYWKAAAVTVAIPSGSAKAGITNANLVALFNADSKFAVRGIAFIDEVTGRFAIRSRNLGETFSVQAVASGTAGDPVNKVFGGDVSVHTAGAFLSFPGAGGYTGATVGASTVANKLFSQVTSTCATGTPNAKAICNVYTDCGAGAGFNACGATFLDPKVKFFADRIEYTLDPVDDLVAGTYVANVELKDRGSAKVCKVGTTNAGQACGWDTECAASPKSGDCASVSGNYSTPSVARVSFQVGTATEEKVIAGNCNSCHQGPDDTKLPNGNLSPDGKKGFVFDFSGHHKLFDFNAIDMCTACHDWEGQSSTGDWSGAKPIVRRVHALHNGKNLTYPLTTVGHSDGDPGRNWDIPYPQDIRNCQQCHPAGTTSGTWATKPSRIACGACHDTDAATAHIKVMTFDLTPANPYSGDEIEACATCHAP